LSGLHTSGLTDFEIATRIIEKYGDVSDRSLVSGLVSFYERALPASLHLRRGSVLPGVFKVLDHILIRENIFSMLLTGNTRAGAGAKLRHYGLSSYFEYGAFAEIGLDRTGIARKAVDMAFDATKKSLSMENVYVIGDTPHDIRCGKAVGARTVAVATGVHSVGELIEHEPWWVIDRIPEPDIFLRKLGIAFYS